MRWLLVVVILSACNPFDYLKYRIHRCDSIMDIYYYPPNAKYNFQETEYCKYTLTILNKDITTMRLNRKYYNKYYIARSVEQGLSVLQKEGIL